MLEKDKLIERKTDGWSLYKHYVNLSNEDKKYKEILLRYFRK